MSDDAPRGPEELFDGYPDGLAICRRVQQVLSISLPHEVMSDRFKEIAHPAPRVWMHHLELRDVSEVDDQVSGWLANAYEAAR